MKSPSSPILPEGWPRPSGYSHGILMGSQLLVSGQIGRDPAVRSARLTGDFSTQFSQAMQNVLSVVRKAGGEAHHIGHLRVYVVDKNEYQVARPALAGVWRDVMGAHYPAMTLVEVSGLVDEGARVEIEAVAVIT